MRSLDLATTRQYSSWVEVDTLFFAVPIYMYIDRQDVIADFAEAIGLGWDGFG